ncbi:MAG TPA: hypothetical protein VFU00_08405 [Gemmatimonadales bacterium]|nr:hypothetical protein [Gemmatimonadales bacterium]
MTARRRFLGWFGASALLAATGSPLAGVETRRRPPEPRSDEWDVSWTGRITGKYKAVFDSPEFSEGAGVWRAVMWRDQHKEIYGTDPADMSAVLVIRHGAIALAMGDAYWEQFRIGKELKMRNPQTRKWEVANPLRTAAPDTPPRWAGYNIEAFQASGGIVLACNLAFGEVVWRYRQAEKLSREAARARALEQLLPGIILQPSGIFAALRAQEAGCAYIMAS